MSLKEQGIFRPYDYHQKWWKDYNPPRSFYKKAAETTLEFYDFNNVISSIITLISRFEDHNSDVMDDSLGWDDWWFAAKSFHQNLYTVLDHIASTEKKQTELLGNRSSLEINDLLAFANTISEIIIDNKADEVNSFTTVRNEIEKKAISLEEKNMGMKRNLNHVSDKLNYVEQKVVVVEIIACCAISVLVLVVFFTTSAYIAKYKTSVTKCKTKCIF